MTLNNGDISGSKIWLQVGSRECVCTRARVCVSGGRGKGSLSANVDSDSFNGARCDNASHMKILLLVAKKPLCLLFGSYNFVT